MSDATIVLLVVVGGIALWGFLTDWTFSGLLPREGARCTPDEDSKDENSKEYIYDADKECLIVNRCKKGWEPNSSNTACISELTGDPCDGSDPNGVYRYDTSGTCALDCNTGYQESGGVCVSACNSTTTEYDETQDGKCLNAENEIVDCTATGPSDFKDITFKRGCGAKDVAYPDIDGICHEDLEIVKGRCNETPGCIGYRRFGNGCARLIINTVAPSYEYTADEDGKDRPFGDIGRRAKTSLDQCKKHCDFDDTCVGISYNPNSQHWQCWWKKADGLSQELVDNGFTFYNKGSEISTGS